MSRALAALGDWLFLNLPWICLAVVLAALGGLVWLGLATGAWGVIEGASIGSVIGVLLAGGGRCR